MARTKAFRIIAGMKRVLAAAIVAAELIAANGGNAAAVNLLPRDTSFETPGGWYSRVSERLASDGVPIPLSNRPTADRGTAWHGRRSLRMRKLDPGDRVEVAFARVTIDEPAAGWRLSAWARADAEDVPVAMSLTDPEGRGIVGEQTVGIRWRRVEIALPADAPAGASYRAALGPGATTRNVWIDAVQLSTDPDAGYVPASPLVVGGWIPAARGGFAPYGRSVTGDFGVFNATDHREWVTIHYELHDLFGGWQDDAYNTIDIEPGEASRLALRLGKLPRGWYDLRVLARTRSGLLGGYRTQFAVIAETASPADPPLIAWDRNPPDNEVERGWLATLGIGFAPAPAEDEIVRIADADDADKAAETIRIGGADRAPAVADMTVRFTNVEGGPEAWAGIGVQTFYGNAREAARARGVPLQLSDAGSWWWPPDRDEGSPDPQRAFLAARKALLDAAFGVRPWTIPPLLPRSWADIDTGTPERVAPPEVVPLSFLASALADKEPAGGIPAPDGVYALLFRGERSHLLAFWRTETTDPVALRLPEPHVQVELTTCAGAPLRASIRPGPLRIPVETQPKLLFVPAGAWESLRTALRSARFTR